MLKMLTCEMSYSNNKETCARSAALANQHVCSEFLSSETDKTILVLKKSLAMENINEEGERLSVVVEIK